MNDGDLPTERECVSNAARLLRGAELLTDRDMINLYDTLANSWLSVADQVREITRV